MTFRLLRLGLSASLMIAAAPSQAYNWGNDSSYPEYAKSKAICRRLGEPAPPAADRPTRAEIKALNGCDSEKLYYGEGAKPDYVKARQCAFIEADNGDETPIGGSSILMQVYANGLGVTRNIDLATTYACGLDSAPAEYDGRVLHLQSLKTKPGRFDYCNDGTSGMTQGVCEDVASKQAAVGRDARLKALQDKLSPAGMGAYPTMKKSFDAFVDAHSDGEVDQTGTARAAEMIDEQDKVLDQFVRDLTRMEAGAWPKSDAAAAEAADAQLNASYRKALVWAASKDNYSTIKPDDIHKTQRVWLTYRDAYVRFAAVAAPNVSADAVTARLTRLRTAQLDQDSN